MNRNEIQAWASTRNTDNVVAAAIIAVASDMNAADRIWEAPMNGEEELVLEQIAVLLNSGEYARSDDDTYNWGDVQIVVAA